MRTALFVAIPAAALLAITTALAQGVAPPAGNAGQAPAGPATPAKNPPQAPGAGAPNNGATWTSANVDPKNPFGPLALNTNAQSAADVKTAVQPLSDAQKAELQGRCNVVIASNVGTYQQSTFDFCNWYLGMYFAPGLTTNG